jgi:hypothetical protein
MTKKHFILLAEVLKYCKPSQIARPQGFEHRMHAWGIVCEEMARKLKEDNSKFDTNKFYIACGYVEL